MLTHHKELVQGTDEWLSARKGILTASEMKHIITPANLKPANNDKKRSHLYELVAQQISGYVEPLYVSDDMLRGMNDEIYARALYEEKYAPVQEVGFITNDKWGFTIGYSPDALVGDVGAIEIKSRRQKFQVQTILENEMPAEYLIQVQTGLLVSEREWCDFISYCGGMPMFVKRIYADPVVQDAIVEAARDFYTKAQAMLGDYTTKIVGMYPTERRVELDLSITASEGE